MDATDLTKCRHDIQAQRATKPDGYRTIFECIKCNSVFSGQEYTTNEQEKSTINFLNNKEDAISIEDTISAFNHLLSKKETEWMREAILQQFQTNMFWTIWYIGFTGGKLDFIHPYNIDKKGYIPLVEIKMGDAYDKGKPYGYINKIYQIPDITRNIQ